MADPSNFSTARTQLLDDFNKIAADSEALLRAMASVPGEKAGALRDSVAAVSVGLVESEPRLDLCYEEDAGAEVDCNIVMTGDGRLVEVQGTAEGAPFDRAQLDALLDLAAAGIADLTEIQRTALASSS